MDPELVRALIGGTAQADPHPHLPAARRQSSRAWWRSFGSWLTSCRAPAGALAAAAPPAAGAGPRFEGYTPTERIARAVAAVIAEKGYGAMSTDDIAAQAAISLSTFYEHFADKRDAVLVALEMSGAQIMALAVPAARRASRLAGRGASAL